MNDDLGKKNSQGRGGGRQKRRYKGEGKDIKEENTWTTTIKKAKDAKTSLIP